MYFDLGSLYGSLEVGLGTNASKGSVSIPILGVVSGRATPFLFASLLVYSASNRWMSVEAKGMTSSLL